METESRHEKVMYALGQIDSKLDGVNQRLDTVNGRLGKHDREIADILEFQNRTAGEQQGRQLTWGKVFAVVGATGTVIGVVSTVAGKLVR